MRIRTAGVDRRLRLCRWPRRLRRRRQDHPDASARRPPAAPSTIWADDQRTAALKPFADEVRQGQRRHRRGPGGLQGPADQLRHRLAAGQGPGHRGRRARLDRQPGPERRHRPGAADRRAEGRRSPRSRSRPSPSTASSTASPYAMENIALIRNTDLAPDRAGHDRGPGQAGQGAQGRRQGHRDHVRCRSGQTGDAYHIYPLYTSAGGYLFGKKANGDYDPKDLGVGKPELGRGVQEDRGAR